MLRGKMKAIVKHHRGYGAQLQVVDIPDIRDDEVLIRVEDDLDLRNGYSYFHLG